MTPRPKALGLALALLPLAAPASLAGPLAVPAPAGQDEVVDKRPELEELLDTLDDHVDARGEEDIQAIALIDKLVKEEWSRSGPKDRKAILKSLDSIFKVKRRELPEGGRDNKLYVAAAVALGEMARQTVAMDEDAEDVAKTLLGWIDHKSHRDDLVLQRHLLLSVGKTRDGKAAEELMSQLLNPHAELVASAAEGLANYDTADEKVRKEIFEEVLKIFGGAKVNVDQDPNDLIARERYDKIEASMITTLQAMTGEDLRDPLAWQSWWNDNKRRDWDEGR